MDKKLEHLEKVVKQLVFRKPIELSIKQQNKIEIEILKILKKEKILDTGLKQLPIEISQVTNDGGKFCEILIKLNPKLPNG